MAGNRDDSQSGRRRQIAEVLVRHGLGYLVGVFGLERLVPFHHGLLGHARRDVPYTRPEHIRLALEELGTTFIKLGQIVSTRSDLLPPEYQVELVKLQDAVPAVPVTTIHDVIRQELGHPVERLFASFDVEPLAAASIGQAHAAILPDGTEVVVKVRRPGVVELVEEDLNILQSLVATASRRWERAEEYDLVGLADEFAQTLRAELDYVREGRNAERFATNFADEPGVHVPRVFWETSSARVLTLERLQGIKISDLDALQAAGIDRSALAERAARITLDMIFEHAFFHADPHPGNFFVEADGRIGLIDFGMVGIVDDVTQERLVRLLVAIAGQDADRLVDTFLDLGVARGRVDRAMLRRDLERLLRRYYGRPLGEISLGALLGDAMEIIRRHRLALPANLSLLLKTAIMCEGLAAQLDPSFKLTGVLVPYAERLMMRQYAPWTWARRLGAAGLEAGQLGVELPRQARRLLGELERGNLQVGLQPESFGPLVDRLERLTNRLVLGIVAAAFINGLAVLMSVYHPAGWEQWAGAAFGIGFVLATALGTYLAWSILRSGRG